MAGGWRAGDEWVSRGDRRVTLGKVQVHGSYGALKTLNVLEFFFQNSRH